MSYRPFLIADYKVGVDTQLEPWLLPANAFQSLFNGYIHNGVINRRAGYEFLADMVHHQTTIAAITAANPGQVTVAAAAGLANGQTIQISYATGGSFTSLNGGKYVITNLVGVTFDLYDEDGNTVDTSAFGVYGGGGVVCVLPELPIMGIKKFYPSPYTINTLIFDTRRSAIYNSSTERFDPLDTAAIFTGGNANFVSVDTYGKTSAFATTTLFFSNFNGNTADGTDAIRSFTSGTTTTSFTPFVDVANTITVDTAQFIFSIKQRLVVLNTVENATQYPQRARWSTALNANDFVSDVPGRGGFVDAPTGDYIVSAKNLQDQILVFFSNSTWALLPTSDPALSFRWKKLNDFRSSDAPYGTIGFDRGVLSLGVRGIFACDGVEAKRIDDKIQDFVIDEINLDFIHKCYGERNYADRRSWILYPAAETPNVGAEVETSNRALIRTDEEGAWSVYSAEVIDDGGTYHNFSSLGFGSTPKDYAFNDFDGVTQPDYAFEDFGDESFSSFYLQAKSEPFLGGDQFGRVFILEKGGNDNGAAYDFEVISAAWNPFKEEGKEAQLGYLDIYADADPTAVLRVDFYADTVNTPYITMYTDLLPEIGFIAEIEGITQANPCAINAPGHGLATGAVVYLYGMTGMENVQGGPYTITVVNANNFTLDGIDSSAFTAYVSGGVVTQNPFIATKCWKRVYCGGVGYEHFIKISHSGANQIVRIHATKPWFRPLGSRLIQ